MRAEDARRQKLLDDIVKAAERAKQRALHGDAAAVLVDLIADVAALLAEEARHDI
jgi:hypothetical protein